ncbi:MAG TPA: F0F1 ATP synthase subunit epsilon [Xanthomonadales bacterium]|nr:F0F1 ATP synthase subunit epsilon [Xanthomonadales bacterium]
MFLQIITPEKTVFNEEIDEILVPTDKGQIGILPHHINLVTSLTHGEMIIKANGKDRVLAVTGGFLEIKNNKVTILADYAEHAENINTQQALEAKNRAEEILKNKKDILPQEDLIRAQAELRRALLELNIAEGHTKRHNRSR